jgi:nitroreductase
VRDPENRKRLQKAAMDQAKVGEAPVVVIAFGIAGEWKSRIGEIMREGSRRGAGGGDAESAAKAEKTASAFLDKMPAAKWLNRHTMIAVTTMMLMAETYGLDTAPMEGFDPEAVKREFGLPAEAEVVALLAIGYASGADKLYGGRLALQEFVDAEHFGRPWGQGGSSAADSIP